MRMLGIIAVLAVITAVGAIFYVLYRQTDTSMTTLQGAPQYSPTANGEQCGEVDFVLGARKLGIWSLQVDDGQQLHATVTVLGGRNADIGLRVMSPSNRVVFFNPLRIRVEEVNLTPTIRGIYEFEFDNRHSAFTDKGIRVTVCLT